MEKSKMFDINRAECVDELRCDPNWPVCLFDYTYKNKVPEFFLFRADPSTFSIIDDYIPSPQDEEDQSHYNSCSNIKDLFSDRNEEYNMASKNHFIPSNRMFSPTTTIKEEFSPNVRDSQITETQNYKE